MELVLHSIRGTQQVSALLCLKKLIIGRSGNSSMELQKRLKQVLDAIQAQTGL